MLGFVLAVLGCAAAAWAEPLPPPEAPALPDGIAAELASLQAQIDELRAAAAKPEATENTDFVPNKLSPHGKPTMELTGGALARLKAITPPGHVAQIDLSITDDFPLAQAIVIISAIPSGN